LPTALDEDEVTAAADRLPQPDFPTLHLSTIKELAMFNTQSPLFLRRVLLADAATGILTGLLLALDAGFLEPLLGLPATLLREAGIVLLPLAAFVGYAGLRKELSRRLVWLVIAFNVLWVVDSAVLLMSGWVAPTVLGQAFIVAQAVAVALFTELEYFGLRRTAAPLAA
jgi:hypothetical protein